MTELEQAVWWSWKTDMAWSMHPSRLTIYRELGV